MSGFIGGLVSKVTGDKKEETQQQEFHHQQQHQGRGGPVVQQQQQPPPAGQQYYAQPPGTVDTEQQQERESPGSFAASFGNKIAGVATSVASSAKEKVGEVSLPDALLEWKAEKETMIKNFKEEKENMIKAIVVGKIDKIYTLATNTIGEVIKTHLKDPYMPFFVQDLMDELVDTFWPDITSEAKERIISGIAPKMLVDHGQRPCCCAGQLLAFFRYYLLPYDRSAWRQLRNPLWWLFLILSLIPPYGIGMITYMVFLFIHDCKDAFAMQRYIVDFKALQFVSLGALSAMIGSVQYYVCLSQTPQTCPDVAPRVEGFIMLIFVGQIFFVWAAFCFLRGAERKGGYKFQYDQASRRKQAEQAANSNQLFNAIASDDLNFSQKMFVDLQAESEEELAAKSVRRLTKFLVWDIIIFILCIIITCFIFFFNKLDESAQADVTDGSTFDTNKNWKLAMSLYWVKAFYGLMSFPFALLKFPIVNTVISHAKPTGFNWWGNTVPYLGEEEPKEDCPWEREYKSHI